MITTQIGDLGILVELNERGNPPGKLADVELHYMAGPLAGLKLQGFGVWQRRGGGGLNVTFPARQYSVNGERRSFALLRPQTTSDNSGEEARERLSALILAAVEVAKDARAAWLEEQQRIAAGELSGGTEGPPDWMLDKSVVG